MNNTSNFDLKYDLIDKGYFKDYCKYRYVDYLYSINNLDRFYELSEEQRSFLSYIESKQFTPLELHSLEQLYDSRRKKIYRLKQKIQQMLQYDCIFLTLTFTDDILSTTSADTRRTYVARYLKKFNTRYVANIDFGQNDNFTKREHYHAIIQAKKVDYSAWLCGAINGQRIVVKNAGALSKYINKITCHAYKKGAGSTRLIFSRGFNKSFNMERVANGVYQYFMD